MKKVSLLATFLFFLSLHCSADTVIPYVDPNQFTKISFGSHSHWAQPWRAYLETIPASSFLNGVGVNYNNNLSDIPKLAALGVKTIRYEESWGHLNYDDPSKIDNIEDFTAFLNACKTNKITPLILINAHEGAPCPINYFRITLTKDVNIGDTVLHFADTSSIVPNHTGLFNVKGYVAANPLFKSVTPDTATLAQGSPVSYSSGSEITLQTLKYAPFTDPTNPLFVETLAGWKSYIKTVASTTQSILGPKTPFYLEIWNELTFGSQYLNAANYGLPGAQEIISLTYALANAASETASANPSIFQYVSITDGFANTIPWTAAQVMPASINGISKHPYHGRNNYPADDTGNQLNSYYQLDTYIPTYTTDFPEYFGTFLQTETMVRDMGPLNDASFNYSGGVHGRFARPNLPCPVWITEYSSDNETNGKGLLRAYSFYLNKGCSKFYYFNANDFLADPGSKYLSNLIAEMSKDLLPNPTPRSLTLAYISDKHNNYQFRGDGKATHPNLYDRDVFAFLPFQVNNFKFVVPYYVMTRDISKTLAPETFTLILKGFSSSVSVSGFDPVTNTSIPVKIKSYNSGVLTIDVSATDYSRYLIFDDSAL